jgi:hypothetical protein
MIRIVKEHYPVSKLPAELREGLDPADQVRITIESIPCLEKDFADNTELAQVLRRPERVLSLDEIFALREPPFRSGQEIDDELRRQRDEWDD